MIDLTKAENTLSSKKLLNNNVASTISSSSAKALQDKATGKSIIAKTIKAIKGRITGRGKHVDATTKAKTVAKTETATTKVAAIKATKDTKSKDSVKSNKVIKNIRDSADSRASTSANNAKTIKSVNSSSSSKAIAIDGKTQGKITKYLTTGNSSSSGSGNSNTNTTGKSSSTAPNELKTIAVKANNRSDSPTIGGTAKVANQHKEGLKQRTSKGPTLKILTSLEDVMGVQHIIRKQKYPATIETAGVETAATTAVKAKTTTTTTDKENENKHASIEILAARKMPAQKNSVKEMLSPIKEANTRNIISPSMQAKTVAAAATATAAITKTAIP